MKREDAIRYLRKWRALVAQVIPSRPTMTAWVGVYPLDPSKLGTRQVLKESGKEDYLGAGPLYRVRFFEVEESLIEADVWLGEEHLHNKTAQIVLGEGNLFEYLSKLGVGPDDLELPDTTDYPI